MPKSRKNLYEGMYILSATLSEDARKRAVEKITSSIKHHAGEVHKIFDQGRKRLAYAIDGRREGYYFVIYYTAGSTSMPELRREDQLNEDLLRTMSLRVDVVPENLDFKSLATSE